MSSSNSSASRKKMNWSREFVRFIKKLQTLPQYKGISYSCLATHDEVKKEFKRKKELYLQHIKMLNKKSRKNRLSLSSKSRSNNLFGGRKRRRRSSRRNRTYRGGNGSMQSFLITGQNMYNETQGIPAVPSNLPYKQNLALPMNMNNR